MDQRQRRLDHHARMLVELRVGSAWLQGQIQRLGIP
jgi:hypothetical protein